MAIVLVASKESIVEPVCVSLNASLKNLLFTFFKFFFELFSYELGKSLRHILTSLSGAIKDIQGAAQYLIRQGCKKVGITGFCMGGSLSLAAAALVPEISAAAPFYGIPPPSLANVSTIKIPVQCHFGSQDVSNTANPTEYGKLRDLLDAGGVEYEFYEYDAGHAFTNPNSANYNKTIAELSVGRMIDFMNKHLS